MHKDHLQASTEAPLLLSGLMSVGTVGVMDMTSQPDSCWTDLGLVTPVERRQCEVWGEDQTEPQM